MQKLKGIGITVAALLFAGLPLCAQSTGQILVTVQSKHNGDKVAPLSATDLQIKIEGKQVAIKDLHPATDEQVELVLLLDATNGRDMTLLNDLASLIRVLGPKVRCSVAYMISGQAVFAGPLTNDPMTVLHQLRVQTLPSSSAYFSIADLARHWPSSAQHVRREVIMVTDGVEPYMNGFFDPSNQYVATAIDEASRAGLTVHTMFWIRTASNLTANSYYFVAQQYMQLVSDGTGGSNYGTGNTAPVTLLPFLEDVLRKMNNQYRVVFELPAGIKTNQGLDMSVKNNNKQDQIIAPKRFVAVQAH